MNIQANKEFKQLVVEIKNKNKQIERVSEKYICWNFR